MLVIQGATHGWPILCLPPVEVAVHPSDASDVHKLFLLCEEIQDPIALQMTCDRRIDRLRIVSILGDALCYGVCHRGPGSSPGKELLSLPRF
jgi:hypothetical protein